MIQVVAQVIVVVVIAVDVIKKQIKGLFY